MANAFRKFGSFLGLVEDDEFFDEEYAEPETREPERGTRESRDLRESARESGRAARESREVVRERQVVRELPVRQVAPVAEAAPAPVARIVTVTPKSFNEARRIGEEFRQGHAVIINLQDVEPASAQRLVDYAAGLVHGLEGKLEKIARSLYVISPSNLDVRDLARATVANDGFFNQS